MSPKNSYDDVPYMSTAIIECDPLRMATVANLYGLDTVDPAACDVLELGCGDGINLLSLASSYPGIRAVGFDPSVRAIERGESWRAGAGLDNLTLLSDLGDRSLDNTADYVIAHGVLSWVHDEPRQQVIESAARAVRPGGFVAFSYRVLPHAYYQVVARDMALEAIEIAEEAAEAKGERLTHEDHARIAIARVRLAATVAGPKSVHGQQMAIEATKMESMAASTLYHDDLSDPMVPFRLSTVAGWAAAHGLQYVGELLAQDLWQYRLLPAFGEKVREEAGSEALRRQQLVDDLVNTSFHNSLFVRAEEPPRPDPSPAGLSIYVRQYPSGTPDGVLRADSVSAPVAQVLREHEHGTVTIEEIAEEIEKDVSEVATKVMELHSSGLARISTYPPPLPAEPGAFPRAVPLVQEQIKFGDLEVVTPRFHLPLRYQSPIHRTLVCLLDGTRDRDAIRRDLPAAAAEAGVEVGVPEVLAELDAVLEGMALDGLLLPPAEG